MVLLLMKCRKSARSCGWLLSAVFTDCAENLILQESSNVLLPQRMTEFKHEMAGKPVHCVALVSEQALLLIGTPSDWFSWS